MGVKSGAGAAVSSGAEYQARVAAYLIACCLCEMPIGAFDLAKLASISFETAASVDDINLTFVEGQRNYIQVKKAIQFSVSSKSEFQSVLKQFVAQHADPTTLASSYTLVTGSGSSRKVTTEMKAALDAFRLGDEESFRRDQPKESVGIIDELLTSIRGLIVGVSAEDQEQTANHILRRMHVLVLDLDPNSTLEHAIVLLLTSQSYVIGRELWGRLITDSLNDATHRHTIVVDQLRSRYEKFRLAKVPPTPATEAQFLRSIIKDIPLATGKEVVFGRFADQQGKSITDSDFALVEFHRFDGECKERLVFKDRQCVLANGLRIELEHRTSTYVGMERFLASHTDLTAGKSVVIIPSNDGDEDVEKSLCAEHRRQILQSSHKTSTDSLTCIHCGKPISSASAELIEFSRNGQPEIGLVHTECTRADDRVVGKIECEFFDKHDFLKNFDVNLWFHAIQRGQGFLNAGEIRPGATFLWGGVRSGLLQGGYIGEMALVGGDIEYVHQRGAIHRLRKDEAEVTVAEFNEMIRQARVDGDPYCVSDQSKTFGKRSLLLKMLGISETLREIATTRVVEYDQKIADRYALWETWYAPMAFLVAPEEEAVIHFDGRVPLISDPIKLDRFVENWKSVGLTIAPHELDILDTDRKFDEFVETVTTDGMQVVIDPVFSKVDGKIYMTSGHRLVPIEELSKGSN